LQRATEIAMEMVTRYGMDKTLGPRTYAPPRQPFLTGARTERVEAAETTEREIDIAVRDIVTAAAERASEILKSRRTDLEEGVKVLLAQETLTAEQFPAIQPQHRQTEPPVG
jgi:cell division protease FtsH